MEVASRRGAADSGDLIPPLWQRGFDAGTSEPAIATFVDHDMHWIVRRALMRPMSAGPMLTFS